MKAGKTLVVRAVSTLALALSGLAGGPGVPGACAQGLPANPPPPGAGQTVSFDVHAGTSYSVSLARRAMAGHRPSRQPVGGARQGGTAGGSPIITMTRIFLSGRPMGRGWPIMPIATAIMICGPSAPMAAMRAS
jgi:hypothetical protein